MWSIDDCLHTSEGDHDIDESLLLEGGDDYLAHLHALIRIALEQEVDKVRQKNHHAKVVLLEAALRLYLLSADLRFYLVTEKV